MLPLAIGTGAGSETWQPMGIAVIRSDLLDDPHALHRAGAPFDLVNRAQRKSRSAERPRGTAALRRADRLRREGIIHLNENNHESSIPYPPQSGVDRPCERDPSTKQGVRGFTRWARPKAAVRSTANPLRHPCVAFDEHLGAGHRRGRSGRAAARRRCARWMRHRCTGLAGLRLERGADHVGAAMRRCGSEIAGSEQRAVAARCDGSFFVRDGKCGGISSLRFYAGIAATAGVR